VTKIRQEAHISIGKNAAAPEGMKDGAIALAVPTGVADRQLTLSFGDGCVID
jgi:hypothetical protein